MLSTPPAIESQQEDSRKPSMSTIKLSSQLSLDTITRSEVSVPLLSLSLEELVRDLNRSLMLSPRMSISKLEPTLVPFAV